MPRFLLFFLLLLAARQPLFAQKTSNVDFDDVKRTTTDPASPHYFPKLLARLQQADTSLHQPEYYYLYYGQVFAPDYRPYEADEISKEFLAAYNAKQNTEALAIGVPELARHPLNLKLRKKLLVCYNRLSQPTQGRHYATPYFGLLYTILGSGDGHTRQTAFVTVTIADEYEILSYYDLGYSKQSLVGSTDVFALRPATEPPRDEQHTFTGQEIYFDARQPLLHLMQETRQQK